MARNVTVVGDGAMGTLCAILLAENGHRVLLWSAFEKQAREIAAARENRRFLPGVPLGEGIEIGFDEKEALASADWAVSAVPTQYVRRVWTRLAVHCPPTLAITSITKGIENDTLLRPTQIIRDALDGDPGSPRSICVLSGPCIAPEVASKLPATVVAASDDAEVSERVQLAFSRPYFRVYTNEDPLGVELAGGTKNVIAIAAGMVDGLEAGNNAKAALVTRGLTEIARLGDALGAHAETFPGLAGMGDLVTTCISPVGRNRSFGERVGRGMSPDEALAATESVVEGVATTRSVRALARRQNVEMPITEAIHAVLFDGVPLREAVSDLMARPLKSED